MKTKQKLKEAIAVMVNAECILPGKVREFKTTCSTPGCKCRRKEDPEKHTGRQMSYTYKRKTKTFSVKKKDVLKVDKLHSNYTKIKNAISIIAHETTEMSRKYGVNETELIVRNLIEDTKRKSIGLKPESQHLRETRKSRDQWKARADNRKIELKSVKRRVGNLEQSRDNWKTKAIKRNDELKDLLKELTESDKIQKKLKAEIDSKKNSTPRKLKKKS